MGRVVGSLVGMRVLRPFLDRGQHGHVTAGAWPGRRSPWAAPAWAAAWASSAAQPCPGLSVPAVLRSSVTGFTDKPPGGVTPKAGPAHPPTPRPFQRGGKPVLGRAAVAADHGFFRRREHAQVELGCKWASRTRATRPFLKRRPCTLDVRHRQGY
jgi:hypothetical protein